MTRTLVNRIIIPPALAKLAKLSESSMFTGTGRENGAARRQAESKQDVGEMDWKGCECRNRLLVGTELSMVSTEDCTSENICRSPFYTVWKKKASPQGFQEGQGIFLYLYYLASYSWVQFICLVLGSSHYPILVYLITNYTDSDIKGQSLPEHIIIASCRMASFSLIISALSCCCLKQGLTM